MMEHNTSIRPATRRLVGNLTLDLPMDPPLITDFGIDSDNHYRALRAVLFNEPHEEIPEEAEEAVSTRMQFLDDAHGNGPRLNALVKLYAPEYADHVKFETSWDVIDGRTGDEAERLQQEAEQKYRGNMAERHSELEPNDPDQPTFDAQDDGRWDHHHPDDLAMLKEIQEDLRGMKEEHEAIAKERRALSEAERKPVFSRDGQETDTQNGTQTQDTARDGREEFFRRSAEEQQQEPVQEREQGDDMER